MMRYRVCFCAATVSYTHLDVYKRQDDRPADGECFFSGNGSGPQQDCFSVSRRHEHADLIRLAFIERYIARIERERKARDSGLAD